MFNVLSFLSGNALNISKIQKNYKVNKRIIKDFNWKKIKYFFVIKLTKIYQ